MKLVNLLRTRNVLVSVEAVNKLDFADVNLALDSNWAVFVLYRTLVGLSPFRPVRIRTADLYRVNLLGGLGTDEVE